MPQLLKLPTKGFKRCGAYINDLVIYSDTWEQHLVQLHDLLWKAKLTMDLMNSKRIVSWLCRWSRQGGSGVSKVEAI